ncbi:methylated-DNA--[protein]-cysteine S-methyltransferase [Candidatus Izemoplasma sp. B36]|uniref:methylated-DNA--[protein]-cysteine S-methyltransferase n=1 Tax=Candidatus Izemoplasma sp. B36 TaxID=3242468 RepID=UPI003555DC3C
METYIYASKIGAISIVYNSEIIISISKASDRKNKNKHSELIDIIISQLDSYFDGDLHRFNIPYNLTGSKFQIDVLNEISKIKYGEIITYKELAIRSGYPNAYRAVGTVCKQNKLPIIIPCHRVVRSDGKIGEYLLGKETKKQLLEMEINNNLY